jgi:DNA modification methylase
MACESTGRVARAIELNPDYCEMAIARWEKATGLTAELIRE